MSQLDIAKWSGRKNVHQNSAYDHVSASELVLKIRSALGDDRQMFGPLAELPKRIVIHVASVTPSGQLAGLQLLLLQRRDAKHVA